MGATYTINFDVARVAALTGFPTDQELFADYEQELRAVVDDIGPISAGADPDPFLRMNATLDVLQRVCEFSVMSGWMDDELAGSGLDDLAKQVLAGSRRGGAFGGPSGADVSWARGWQTQKRQQASKPKQPSLPEVAAPAPPVAGERQPVELIEVNFPDPMSGQ